MKIQDYIAQRQTRVEEVLSECLSTPNPATSLDSAMAYAVLGGGKRLRSLLAYASAETLGAASSCADAAACALELIHGYSLIHDDLPAMDDDDLRRGKPSCHVVYGEATAILAGDALQTLAFEVLADSSRLAVGDGVRLRMLSLLARAAGRHGMVLGQSIDIDAAGNMMDEQALERMHRLKTGALISASVQLGALSTGGAGGEDLKQLDEYALAVGLAFQVQDDILDIEGDTETLGKHQGKDRQLEKPTYPAILGVDGARLKAKALCEQGIATLDKFGNRADPLRELAGYIVQRTH